MQIAPMNDVAVLTKSVNFLTSFIVWSKNLIISAIHLSIASTCFVFIYFSHKKTPTENNLLGVLLVSCALQVLS
jgi:hypothetical protein